MNFFKEAENCIPQLSEDIARVCRIKSVEGEPKEGMPFGEGPAEALKAFLSLGSEMGFETENFQNYAGHIDFGEGEDILGILAHVDVVPEGKGWKHDPWGGEISDGAIWGRGTVDDKGPAMVCLYAMKILKDSNVKLSKKVRLILGTNEETNWGCMDYYLNKVKPKLPVCAFSPDASFPVVYAEKGIYQFTLSKKTKSEILIEGGEAFNAVPSSAYAVLKGISRKEAEEKSFSLKSKCSFLIEEEGENLRVTSFGKGGHAAELEGTCNALTGLFEFLSVLDLKDGMKEIAALCQKAAVTTGEELGVNCEDESGKLTVNFSKASLKNGRLQLSFDIRIPVTKKLQPVRDRILTFAKENNFSCEEISAEEPLYTPKDSPLVKSLMESYQKVTGDHESQPVASGGGTYSRCIPNCVAFGCILPTQENNIHKAEENLKLSHMELWLRIYLEAIYHLAK